MAYRHRKRKYRFRGESPLRRGLEGLRRRCGALFAALAGGVRSLSPRARLVGGAVALVLAAVLIFWPRGKGGQDDGGAAAAGTLGTAGDGLVYVTPSPTLSIGDPLTLTPVTPTPTPDPTLRRGMENEQVQELQERLMTLGYMDLDASTLLFGPQTEDAVKRFQRQVNFTETLGGIKLDEDGVAGAQTQEILYGSGAPKYVVKYGMSGEDITDMQDQLKELGYMSSVTGFFGDKTVEALKAFQSRNRLSADGLAGEQTFQLLYSDNAKESESKANQARTTANIDKMIQVAKDLLGKKYVWGHKGPDTFDCSGFVYYCLKQAGSNRRRLNAAGYSQVGDWEKITSMNSLKKGDLIFFYDDNRTKVGHVGIIINSSEMIDASFNKGKIVRRSYWDSYWKKHFVCGRRPW